MEKRLLSVTALVALMSAVAPLLFAGGAADAPRATEGTAATATTAGADIVLVAGRYTWPKNWLETPTASQLGITAFNEAPMLAEMVARGELPRVEDRLPADPLVIAPFSEVGQYGGTLRVARLSPGDWGDMYRGQHAFMFRPDPTSNLIIPYLAKGIEVSDENRIVTIFYREGARWSDGEPFTVHDTMWVYEHTMQDPAMRNFNRGQFTLGGELAKFEAIDDYTLRITVPVALTQPKLSVLMAYTRSRQGRFYGPVHFLQQFHPKFNPDAEKLAAAEGYDNWIKHFDDRLNFDPRRKYIQPEMGPWYMSDRDSKGITRVRNPYFWAVDTAGNQLPYIDNLTMSYFSQSEVAILSMMQGSVDLGGRLPDPADFALYKENESIGDYTLREWQDLKTARMIYMFNLNHEDPVKRQVFLDQRFRHAMSLAINREEINEFAFNGLATPQQFTVAAGTEFYDPAWATAFADYDPARAKAMLDEIGLRDTDGDGVREGPDGNPFALSMSTSSSSVIGPMGFNISELVRDYWQEVGVRVDLKMVSEELYSELRTANQLDVHAGVAGDYNPNRLASNPEFGTLKAYAENWNRWWQRELWVQQGRQGEEPPAGEEPPEEWKRFIRTGWEWPNATDDEEFNRLGRERWALQAELLPAIGTVAYVVRPIIINNRVRNVPDVLPFAFESMLWIQATPAQFYIAD